MKVHGLLLQRDGEHREERRHDGRVAVDQRNTRWCSDGLEIAYDIGLIPCTTPVSCPQSNGMAEAFVRTLKRDYARVNPTPDARTVIEQLPGWFAHYNDVHSAPRFALSITPRVHRPNPRGPVRPLGGKQQ